jgi:YD repeat-containing protein
MLPSNDPMLEEILLNTLTPEQQQAILDKLEESQRQAEEDQQNIIEEAARVVADRVAEVEAYVDSKLVELTSIAKIPGPAGKTEKVDYKVVSQLANEFLASKQYENEAKIQDALQSWTKYKLPSVVAEEVAKLPPAPVEKGADGKSIVDVYWAADGSLVCVLSDGTELDTGPLLGNIGGGDTNVSVSNWAGYSTEELKATFVAHTFETVNKNLEASAGTLAYDANDDLISITYANGVVKTLAYDAGGDLTSVTLSGNTPEGIDLVKTFSYDANANLTSFTYS